MSHRIFRLLVFLGFANLFLLSGYSGEDLKPAHQASPDHYALLFENEAVLVLKMVLKPGEADVMHHHQNETVYFQKGGTLLIKTADGEAIKATVPDGHIMWHEAWSHQVTNVGESEVIAIIVEANSKEEEP